MKLVLTVLLGASSNESHGEVSIELKPLALDSSTESMVRFKYVWCVPFSLFVIIHSDLF